MSKVKISVDHNKCVGSRLCLMFSPEVFALNENGQSYAKNMELAEEIEIISTAEQCPQCAIQIENIETGEVLFPPPGLAF